MTEVRTPAGDAPLGRALSPGSVGGKAARGFGWSLLGGWSVYVVQLGTTMVLARLLTPAEFGVMAMALTLTVLADQFRNLGLSHAVIQSETITWSQVNGLFWVNTAVGVTMGAIVALGGIPLAAFYDQPALRSICLVLGIGYILSGLAVQHGALLNRRMQFRPIAVRNALAVLAGSVAAVTCALAGLGVWSLAVQNVVAIASSTVFMWAAVNWRPSRPRDLRSTLPLVKFGSHVTFAGLATAVSRQSDNIIIGRVLDAGSLGLYTKAYSLLTLPLRQLRAPLSGVMIPTLSALQSDPVRYRGAYLKTVRGLAHAGMPFVVVLAVSALEIVGLVLGDQWLGAAYVFQILAVASFVQLVSTTAGWIFVSSGRTKAYVSWSVVSSALTVGSFLVGVRWGIEGVAAAYAVGQVVMFIPCFMVACRDTPIRVGDPLRAMARPTAVAVAVLAASLGVRNALDGLSPVLLLLATVAGGALAWMVVLAVWRRARAEIVDLLSMLKRARSRRGSGGTRTDGSAGSA